MQRGAGPAHSLAATCLVADPLGRCVATGGQDHQVKLWACRSANSNLDGGGGADGRVSREGDGGVLGLMATKGGELPQHQAFIGHPAPVLGESLQQGEGGKCMCACVFESKDVLLLLFCQMFPSTSQRRYDVLEIYIAPCLPWSDSPASLLPPSHIFAFPGQIPLPLCFLPPTFLPSPHRTRLPRR